MHTKKGRKGETDQQLKVKAGITQKTIPLIGKSMNKKKLNELFRDYKDAGGVYDFRTWKTAYIQPSTWWYKAAGWILLVIILVTILKK